MGGGGGSGGCTSEIGGSQVVIGYWRGGLHFRNIEHVDILKWGVP